MNNLIKRSDVCCYKMSFGYVLGEVVEVWEEVLKLDVGGVWSELLDVYSCGMVWLSDVIGYDLYIINNKSIRSWSGRWGWWKRWLNACGLEFKAEYMRNGANFKRKAKREWVLEEAIRDQEGIVDLV
jgi:hypothetical protein